jgi:hypothetical protein
MQRQSAALPKGKIPKSKLAKDKSPKSKISSALTTSILGEAGLQACNKNRLLTGFSPRGTSAAQGRAEE